MAWVQTTDQTKKKILQVLKPVSRKEYYHTQRTNCSVFPLQGHYLCELWMAQSIHQNSTVMKSKTTNNKFVKDRFTFIENIGISRIESVTDTIHVQPYKSTV